jgi:hypothetical protein
MNVTRREAIGLAAAGLFAGGLLRRAGASVSPHLIWRKPAPAAEILRYGPGGRAKQPKPPFRFEEEDMGGSNPKVKVRDAAGTLWIVKWDEEVHAEACASRIAACAGYFVRAALYMPEGRIEGVRDLRRAAEFVDSAGRFEKAVLKLIAPDQPYMAGANWSWTNNPFLYSEPDLQRLNGLKIVMMLTSNWDNKDARDPERGVNTAIYEEKGADLPSYLYAFDDWGATMGRWGGIIGRSKWDAQGFAEQTPELVAGRDPRGFVAWGFGGTNGSDLKTGIRPNDVQALLRHFTGLRPEDWRAGLQACGATKEETRIYSQALLSRLAQLKKVAA